MRHPRRQIAMRRRDRLLAIRRARARYNPAYYAPGSRAANLMLRTPGWGREPAWARRERNRRRHEPTRGA